ncbi:ArsR family transcriptional regulator [Candidatus Woesearchaeota archaeon]|nr:ArsR family transcriptional regulator [Candidatus Woesearchaeota archaeon]
MIDRRILSYVWRAKNRRKVLELLSKRDMVSAEIEKATEMYKAHISRTLKELKSKNLIVCVNPEDRTYKFYKATISGKKVLEEIERRRLLRK